MASEIAKQLRLERKQERRAEAKERQRELATPKLRKPTKLEIYTRIFNKYYKPRKDIAPIGPAAQKVTVP